jgi:hypothetical protein
MESHFSHATTFSYSGGRGIPDAFIFLITYFSKVLQEYITCSKNSYEIEVDEVLVGLVIFVGLIGRKPRRYLIPSVKSIPLHINKSPSYGVDKEGVKFTVPVVFPS